jgi:hypothetical protein
MYPVHFSPGAIKALGEEGFVVFDTQTWNHEEAGAEEKNTRDPEGVPGSIWRCISVHGEALLSETEMLSEAL